MAKKRRRKKKRSSHKAVWIAIIVFLLILVTAAIIIALNWKKIVKKAEDLLPSSFTYPTEYEEFVLKYSKEYNVDPVLIFSIIKTESGFDPKATSDVGARGLMQIMPEAFNWLKFHMNDNRDITFDSMYDPQTNIQYGTYFLSFLMQRYDNSIELTAAAYHGGFGAVDGWLEKGIVKKGAFRIEDIPKENDMTAEYVRRITKAYSRYKEVLKEKQIIKN